jgi:hypothetical protein
MVAGTVLVEMEAFRGRTLTIFPLAMLDAFTLIAMPASSSENEFDPNAQAGLNSVQPSIFFVLIIIRSGTK